MREWKLYKLKKLTTKIGSGATPKGGKDSYQEEGISLIRSQNVLDFEFSKNGLAFIDEDQASALSNVVVCENDVLLNITGDSVARVCMVPKDVLPARVNQHVAIIRTKPELLNPDYLKYFLLNPVYKKHLLMIASDGGTRDALTKGNVEELEIRLPSNRQEQDQIADILSCLDHKIALLQRQNQTLEKIAQTLFKHWFIDFEFPNQEGKPYRSSGGEMVASEFGEVPVSFKLKTIGELAKNHSQTFNFTGKKAVTFINTGDVLNGKFLHENLTPIDLLPGQAKKAIKKGDILYSEIRPINRHFAFVNFDAPNYVVSTKFMVIKSLGQIHPRLLYLILKQKRCVDHFNYTAESRSGTFPQITFDSISDYPIILPDPIVQEKFINVLNLLMDKQENNEKGIQTLTKTRDTLLPKLMSGQIRIQEAEIQIP